MVSIKNNLGINKNRCFFSFLIIMAFFFTNVVLADGNAKDYTLFYPHSPTSLNINQYGNLKENLFTGAVIYNLPLEVMPGTNGLQPKLSLNYNRHLALNNPNLFGSGWELNNFYIAPNPRNSSVNSYLLVNNGALNDLIYVPSEGRFHTEIENDFYIENKSGGNNEKGIYWVLKTKGGILYRFGYNNYSELLLPNYNVTALRWSLDLINDTHENSIYYTYQEDPTPNDIGTTYPRAIIYNNDQRRIINFVLEPTDRNDMTTRYFGGSEVRYARRINEINFSFDNKLVKKYVLGYSYIGTINVLKNITFFGSDGNTSLPPTKLSYFELNKGWTDVTGGWTFPNANYSGELYFSYFGDIKSIRLEDINRDGLVDLVRSIYGENTTSNLSVQSVFINNGSSWLKDEKLVLPVDFYIQVAPLLNSSSNPFNSPREAGGIFSDIDGDGLNDLVRLYVESYSNGSTKSNLSKVWLNNGTGWADLTLNWSFPNDTYFYQTFYFNGSMGHNVDLGVRIFDVNGDQLNDLTVAVKANQTKHQVYLNNKTGWYASGWGFPPSLFFIDVASDLGARFGDINDDGLTDIVRLCKHCGYQPWPREDITEVWLNNGSGWFNATAKWAIPGGLYFIETNASSNMTNVDHSDTGLRLIDIDNNGMADLVLSFKNESGVIQKIFLNNGTGWKEDYNWFIPQEAYFTEGYGNNNDRGVRIADADGDGANDLIQMYLGSTIANNVWLNNVSKSYALQNVTSPNTGITSFDYRESTKLDNTGDDGISDLGFNLWVIGEKKENDGIQNFTTVTVYNYSGGYYNYKEDEFRGFSYTEETRPDDSLVKHWFYQDDGKKGKEHGTWILDDQNNLYEKRIYIWNDTEQDGYHRVLLDGESIYTHDGVESDPQIITTYYDYDLYGNIIAKDSWGDIGKTGDEKHEYWEYVYNTTAWIVNKIKKYRLYNYNNSTKLTETKYSYDGQVYGSNFLKGDLTLKEEWLEGGINPITTYSYNIYGNIIQKIDPNNHTIDYVYGIRDTTHTFADQMINAKGQTVNYYYDLGTGNLLSEADSNNFATNYTYDVFGRISTEIRPYDSYLFPTKVYEYNFDGNTPEGINVKKREEHGLAATYDQYYFYDGFGRLVQRKDEAEDFKQIVIDFYYDRLGRIKAQSNPYFTNDNPLYYSPNHFIRTTNYTYDPLGRVRNITNPDYTNKTIVFDHWKITRIDENRYSTIYYLDAYDRIVNITEDNNGTNYHTFYNYDAKDNLIGIIDNLAHSFNYTYDALGRKTSSKDLDLGGWNYSYDPVGNLIASIDSRGIIITMAYDVLDRMLLKNSSKKTVIFIYDQQLNSTLSRVEMPFSITDYSYDQRLRKRTEVKNVSNAIFNLQWYYDALDRTKSKVLPNGSVINFSYNQQNKLEYIPGILTNIDYNELNLPTKRFYRNGLISNFTYDPNNLRLIKINTGSEIQELDYEYDGIGNVKRINDLTDSKIKQMNYDDLNRMTWVNDTDYAVSYTYDPLGNMLNVSFDHLKINFNYGLVPVHGPKQVIVVNTSG